MKAKKLFAVLLAVVMAATFVMPASAAELSDVTPNNSTKVTANIDTGTVSYVITIPATADFGSLTQPDDDNDHYIFYDFEVEATDLTIKSNQGVSIYMKDSSATDNQFYISQQDVADPFKLAYDVYNALIDAETIGSYDPINTAGTPGAYGYHICTFLAGSTEVKQAVTLALNQNALYGQTLSEIAGDYSGTIAFHSALVEVG